MKIQYSLQDNYIKFVFTMEYDLKIAFEWIKL